MRGEAVREHSAQERVSLLKRLAALSCLHRPERVAVREMRKFAGWWLPGLTGAGTVLGMLNAIETLDAFNACMDAFLNGLVRAGDVHVHPELLPDYNLDTL